ncbi:MAG: coenzyme F420-0:L-glutamate ligase [Candidatus Methanomethylicia archaeon]|nr:coenzyme F420-0:L-glutamate ligase [Candidatus Methanomethylicia archaeon]MCX8168908.1 coenzyme F420-0:L-glutamate ligase [Candidatus Methanomethylicia archaeon]MDW7988640.1 coenzyme F420-0:L-glutamate ligase [Nitrososphaerota archaeon]
MFKCKYVLRGLKRTFDYWYPKTNVVSEIVKVYGGDVKNGDIIVISEKALCVAKGNIYDERDICKVDPLTKKASYIVNKLIWGKVLKFTFKSKEIIKVVEETPLNLVAQHKKLGLKYGGLLHFLKPYSEAGIDATNLPYMYVSLPIRNAKEEVRNIKIELSKKLKKNVNVLIIDTDRTFKIKGINGIAISTRPSSIRGIIDLGGLGYIMGKVFNNIFLDYPTPVAYNGIHMELTEILRITKFADKIMGFGFGRNILEMLTKLGKESFNDVKWSDMKKIKHYPVVIVRLRKIL